MAISGFLPKQADVEEEDAVKISEEEQERLTNHFLVREIVKELQATGYGPKEIEMILGVHPDGLKQPLEALIEHAEMNSDNSIVTPFAKTKERWQYLVKKFDSKDFVGIEIDGKVYYQNEVAKAGPDFPFKEALVDYNGTKIFALDTNRWDSALLPALNSKPLVVSEREQKYRKLRKEGMDRQQAEFKVKADSAVEGVILPKLPQKLEIFDQDENYLYMRLPDLPNDGFAKKYRGARVEVKKDGKDFNGVVVEVGKNVEKKTSRKPVCEFYSAKVKLKQPADCDFRNSLAHVDKNLLKEGRRMYFTKELQAFEKELKELANGKHSYANYTRTLVNVLEDSIGDQIGYHKVPVTMKTLPMVYTLLSVVDDVCERERRMTTIEDSDNSELSGLMDLKVVSAKTGFKLPNYLITFLNDVKDDKFNLDDAKFMKAYPRGDYIKTKAVIQNAKSFLASQLDLKYEKNLFDAYKKKFLEDPTIKLDNLSICDFINMYNVALKANKQKRNDLKERIDELQTSKYDIRGSPERFKRKIEEGKELENKLAELSGKENPFALNHAASKLDAAESEIELERKRLAFANLNQRLDYAKAEKRKLKKQLSIYENLDALENFEKLNSCLYEHTNLVRGAGEFLKFYEGLKFAMASDEESADHHFGAKKIEIDALGISFEPVQTYCLLNNKTLYAGEKFGTNYRLHLSRVLPSGETKTNGEGFAVPLVFNDFLYTLSLAQRDGKEYAIGSNNH